MTGKPTTSPARDEGEAYQRGWDAFAAAINGHSPTVPANSTEALHWSEGLYDAAADYAVWGFQV